MKLTLTHASAITVDTEAPRWLIEGFLPAQEYGLLIGAPKVGKGWLVLEVLVAIASGLPFLGRYPVQQGAVCLYSPEGNRGELRARLDMICARYGVDLADIPVHIFEPVTAEGRFARLYLEQPAHQREIFSRVREVEPVLCVFDPLNKMTRAGLSNNDELAELSCFFDRLVFDCGCAAMLVHHEGKAGGVLGGVTLVSMGAFNAFLKGGKNGGLSLTSQQKHHATPAEIVMLIDTDADGNVGLKTVSPEEAAAPREKSLEDRIIEVLKKQVDPITQTAIRNEAKGDTHRYPEILTSLETAGRIGTKKRGKTTKYYYIEK